MYDPFTGLVWPLRIEKMEATVQEGLSCWQDPRLGNIEFRSRNQS